MILQAQLDTRALESAFSDNIKSVFLSEPEDDELEASKKGKKHVKGCNQHEDQPGCTMGNRGQIDNKLGESGLIADKIQHPAQWKPIHYT